jgi:hypothetical protein
VVVSLAALGALSAFAGAACLPDLDVATSTDAAPASSCGDGFIDPDAGEECDPGSGDGGATTVCRDCRVACVVGSDPTTIDPASHHCYFEPGQTAQESDAVNACSGAGGHVVRFVSASELALVSTWAATAPFWVGLMSGTGGWFPNELTSEPGWVAGCPGCFAGGDDGGAIVKGTLAADQGRCVVGGTPGAWSESVCSSSVKAFSRWTVCEREPVGTRARPCGANICLTIAATQSSKHYVVVPTPFVANDAALACVGLGGRLVVFGSAEEREQVAYEIAAQRGLSETTGFWMGLASTPGAAWAWDTSGGMAALPWGGAQPAGFDGGRAYMLVEQGQPAPDSELARAGNASDGGGEVHFALCETP